MRTSIIVNPAAGNAAQSARLRELVAARPDVRLIQTEGPGHARELAGAAVEEGADIVVAAGGDGTINEVVQGLGPYRDRARLGLVPLGTGNDLARTLGVPFDPVEAFALLDEGRVEALTRAVDLVHVESAGQTRYCLNVAAGGFSGQVDEALTDEMKSAWGPLAYVRGAMKVLPDLTGYETTIAWDDQEFERVEALNVIVANGRTCAGGIKVASGASMEDGLLDVVIVRYASLLDLAAVAARLLTGDYLESDEVMHRRASRVRIAAKPGMWFNVDGELLSNAPISFSVEHRALRVLAGPGYAAGGEGS
ncbi:diacylglycerol/lipid kinase family protein [Sorangium sp. So ce1335]|uniref:diacylglycerol/lipid kinase family protein n=1 Tax=Sorangium sp. So ce1335 TaxID=3133335 RepID=UPI003F6259EB